MSEFLSDPVLVIFATIAAIFAMMVIGANVQDAEREQEWRDTHNGEEPPETW